MSRLAQPLADGPSTISISLIATIRVDACSPAFPAIRSPLPKHLSTQETERHPVAAGERLDNHRYQADLAPAAKRLGVELRVPGNDRRYPGIGPFRCAPQKSLTIRRLDPVGRPRKPDDVSGLRRLVGGRAASGRLSISTRVPRTDLEFQTTKTARTAKNDRLRPFHHAWWRSSGS